jgi:large subunit ribosomal protein L17
MRHRVAHRKLGRVTEHRIAMLRNQTIDLIKHERIRTTVARAKELRPFVERIITVAKRSLNAEPGSARAVNARRLVAADIADKVVVQKLFSTIAPRYVDRPGGYTRILRLGHRRGDAAEVAEVELLGSEYNPDAATAEGGETPKPKKKSVGERVRDAIGGRRAAGDDGAKTKASRPSRAATRKVTTPRKAGGA